MAHPCDDQNVSISVRDLAVLLNAADCLVVDCGDLSHAEEKHLRTVEDSYGDMLTRMANGSEAWREG